MSEFTVLVEFAADGGGWEPRYGAQNCDTSSWGSGWTAEQVAYNFGDDIILDRERHQSTDSGKPFRIRVWEGYDADTDNDTPAHEFINAATDD